MLVKSLRVFIVLYLTMSSSEGTQCLYGVDLPLPTDTNQVIECGEYQSCYLDAVVTINGAIRYYSGCRENLFCDDTSKSNDEILNDEIRTNIYNKRAGEIIVCSQCCNGTLCNSKGCRYPGYPTQRGPICMSCDDQLTPTDCYKISECGRGEVCMLNTFLHPSSHQRRYRTKCELAERCERDLKKYLEIRNTYQIMGRKRKSNELLTQQDVACDISCCSDDLCNGNCTALQQPHLTTSEPLTATSSMAVPTITTTAKTLSSTSTPTTTTISPSTSTTVSTLQTKPTTTSTPITQAPSTEGPLICLSNPCLRGQCLEYRDTFYCKCPKGYIGRQCEENIFAQTTKTPSTAFSLTTTKTTAKSTPSISSIGGSISSSVSCSSSTNGTSSCTSSTSGGTSCIVTASGGIFCNFTTSGRHDGTSSLVSRSVSSSTSACKGGENVTFVSIGDGPSYHISAHNHSLVTHSEAVQKCAEYCSRLLRIDNIDKLRLVRQYMKNKTQDFFQRTYWIDGEWKHNSWQSSFDTKRSKRTLVFPQKSLNLANGKCASLKFEGIHATLESNFCHTGHVLGFICERS